MGNDKAPSANVEFSESLLRAAVEDAHSETLEIFERLSRDERNAFPVDAWTVGLRALNVELVNEAEEVRTPVRLSSMPPRG